MTETVLVVPALMLAVMFVIQFGLWWHAQHVVAAVAREGVRVARLQGATAQDGQQRASRFLAVTGAKVVNGPTVRVIRNTEIVTADVAGRAVAVVPGMALPVHATASGRTEDFRGDL